MEGRSGSGDLSARLLDLRTQLTEDFERRLRERQSPIVDHPDATGQLLLQAGSVLDDVIERIVNLRAGDVVNAALTKEIGASRALREVHPVESVQAAAVLFEVALPIVWEAVRMGGDQDVPLTTVATELHWAIMRRIAVGSVSYASYLLKKMHGSQQEERRRMARDLHDRVAHTVGIALQDLELHAVYEWDGQNVPPKLTSATQALTEAIDLIRQLSSELRESVRECGGMERALAFYLARCAPAQAQTSISIRGDLRTLPIEVAEELYIILREAIRNTFVHSAAGRVEVQLEVSATELCAHIVDNGLGFDVEKALDQRRGVGLSSMRERSELLGGKLVLNSIPGAGTTVDIVIPLIGLVP